MPAVAKRASPGGDDHVLPLAWALILARAACLHGVTRAGLARDLAGLVDHEMPLPEWRNRVPAEVDLMRRHGLVVETRGRLSATPLGKTRLDGFFGHVWPVEPKWEDQRDIRLVAKALGLDGESPDTVKALAKAGAVRALILQKAFGLPIKPTQSMTRLRAQLAIVALERAFGDKIKSGFGQGGGLPARAGRLLAGHLSKSPRDFGTDGRLVAALAAEQVESDQSDELALRIALLRRFVSRGLAEREAPDPDPTAAAARVAIAPKKAEAAPARPAPGARPDLPGFAAEVQAAARRAAEGWPPKAYISRVWDNVRTSAPEWSLSEIEFKCMLAEAHRAGRVMLATADLKDKRFMKEIEESAVTYKNTVWHFVRVQEG